MAETQKTISRSVTIEGIGLHSGAPAAVTVGPAEADRGIVFVRRDLGGAEIPAAHRHVQKSSLATSLACGSASVSTVEHVLSALGGLGIDNARIEVDGPEIPIMDGSGRPFAEPILAAGIRSLRAERRYITLRRPIAALLGEKEILAIPANELRITYAIDFAHPAIGYQAVTSGTTEREYLESIAPARTFCLLRDVEAMKRSGLVRGGSLQNAVVVGDQGVLNPSLRFPDEFVRHKVLDLIGDLTLLGPRLRAHVIVFKGGHRLHATLLGRILASRASWDLVTSDAQLPAAQVERFAHLMDRVLPRPVSLHA